jgi:hypothetical protein
MFSEETDAGDGRRDAADDDRPHGAARTSPGSPSPAHLSATVKDHVVGSAGVAASAMLASTQYLSSSFPSSVRETRRSSRNSSWYSGSQYLTAAAGHLQRLPRRLPYSGPSRAASEMTRETPGPHGGSLYPASWAIRSPFSGRGFRCRPRRCRPSRSAPCTGGCSRRRRSGRWARPARRARSAAR